MKIAATISCCVQTGEHDYTTYRNTKIFATSCTLDEIIEWQKRIFPQLIFNINEVQFSTVEEETE
jgi:hypothetical protein